MFAVDSSKTASVASVFVKVLVNALACFTFEFLNKLIDAILTVPEREIACESNSKGDLGKERENEQSTEWNVLE